MSRHILSLSHKQLTSFDLDAFVAHAHALNQHNRDTFSTPFPQDPSRWLSHYEFTPHPIELTSQGDVDGGLSWLACTTLDFSFTRSLCAPSYGTRGGSCYDPASLVVLAVAAKVDPYTDYAQFCTDLHDSDKGRRYRQLAGLHGSVPGEDDLCHFRYRVGDDVIHQIVDRTDGVPLFVEELTKSALESGLLREEAYRYVLDGTLSPFAIPTEWKFASFRICPTQNRLPFEASDHPTTSSPTT